MQQQLLRPLASTRGNRNLRPLKLPPLLAFSDPLWLGPCFLTLVILHAVLQFPHLTFSLADVLGLTVDFSEQSWPQIALLTALRLYFFAIVAKTIWTRSLLLPGIVSAGLLFACYFPLAWGWLGWVALVPLLLLARSQASAWRIYVYGGYAGLAFFWPALEWMRVADFRMYGTWAMLSTYCALYFPAALFLIRRLDRGTVLPLIVSVPIVWTALEFIRSFLLTGFAWYYLGHTQHQFLPVIQISDLAGAYAVTFVLAAVNAWLFEALYSLEAVRSVLHFAEEPAPPAPARSAWPGLKWQALAVAGLVIGALFYGFWRLEQQDFASGPRIALLQGNLDQRIRNMATGERNVFALRQINDHYQTLCHSAAAQQPSPDLIVWPETSFPFDWYEVASKLPTAEIPAEWALKGERIQSLARLMAATMKTQLLLGLNANVLDEKAEEVRYNSALLVTPGGKWGPRYDKMHRVPFGEFIPELPFMERFAPYEHPYSITAGERFTRFPLGKHHFGVIICYEDTDPYLARQYCRPDADGPAADFLVNISNDGWFDGSSEHDEHLAICRFRAVECRRAIARSVNMGVSAVIDGNGRVLPAASSALYGSYWNWHMVGPEDRTFRIAELPVSEWTGFKKTAGIMTAVIPIDDRTSLYGMLGDWLPWTCWGVILAGLAWSVVRSRHVPIRIPDAAH